MIFVLAVFYLLGAPAGEPAPSPDPYEQALALYDQGRFAEAAEGLEALAATTGQPTRRFEAGQMRIAAGHMAHAWRHFEGYLGSSLDAEQRETGEARLAKAAAGTRVIEARVMPTSVASKIVARRVGDPSGLVRPDLETVTSEGRAALRLDPGPWELRVDVPGYLPLRQMLTVDDAAAPVELRLVPVPVGAAVVPAPTKTTSENAALRRARAQRNVGAALLPVGAVALGGVIATAVAYRRSAVKFQGLGTECNDLEALSELQSLAQRQVAGMVGLGVLTGTLITTGVVLLVRGQRALPRARVALELHPQRAGLMLSGKF